jgi:two-component system, OmpR family, alkaline phosphatase synthesis response regulator PhoP
MLMINAVSRKVLIVEDHKYCRDILALQLDAMGYDVVEADSAIAALAKAETEMPDLIIMDLRMPGIDGIEATRRLKANPRTQLIPVVVYTAWGAPNCKKEVLEAGAALVLTKPDSASDLRVLLQQLQ